MTGIASVSGGLPRPVRCRKWGGASLLSVHLLDLTRDCPM